MMSDHLGFSFTEASAVDLDELVTIRIEAMRAGLERIGRFDPARARERFESGFQPEHTRFIKLDECRIGFVVVKPRGDDLLLDHLYLRPGYQGCGIGAAVLAQVFAEADALGFPVRVGALRQSPANEFYLRHGFIPETESEWDLYYVRTPRPSR